ncbi:MAG: VanW family protein, partial [Clostridiales bacterium]|nr:VanW family protein [Clostridiales bacterium]
MKKNGNGNDKNSLPAVRPGVRAAMNGGDNDIRPVEKRGMKEPEFSARPERVSDSKGKKRNVRNKKKGGAGKVVAGVAAALIIIAGAGAGVLWKKGLFEKKYEVSYADGTVAELTVSELREGLSSETFAPGIIVGGVDVGGMTKEAGLQAVKDAQPDDPFGFNIQLNLDDVMYDLDLSSLSYTSDVDQKVEEAYAYLKPTGEEDADALINIFNAREALKSTPKEFEVEYTLVTDGVDDLVHGVLDDKSTEAVDAELTGFDEESLTFTFTDSQRGYVVDVDSAVTDVKALLDAGTYTGIVDVAAQIEEPAVTSEDIENDFGLVSSASSTTSANSNRNHNISITCEKLNGLILNPGDSFSFNTYIGQRTSAAGYLEAGVIVNGALEQDLGGGVCQVSSMLYQAAVKADLQIDERHEHMWPSSYAVAGTDAAVDYPAQDFKFTNNSGYPIYISAYWNPDNSVITINFYGHMFPDGQYIDFIGETISTNPAGTQYVANESMEVGTTSQVRAGHNGVTAVGYQVWYDANGNEIERIALPTSHYATITTLIEVGVLNSDGSIASLDGETGELSDVVDEDDDDDD